VEQQSILQIYAGRTGADVLLDTELVYTASGIFGQPDTENNSITLRGAYKNTVLADGYMYTTNAADADLIDVKGTAVAYNVNTEKAYNNLMLAIAEAKPGETVKILVDLMNETVVTVVPGVTLDLNGHTLKAMVVGASFVGSNIVDSSADNTGLLIVPEAALSLYIENEQLPVKTPEGYKFVEVSIRERLTYNSKDDSHTFALGMFDEGTDLLLAELIAQYGLKETRVQLRVHIEWTGVNGNPADVNFLYLEDLVEDTMQDNVDNNRYRYGMSMQVFGVSSQKDVTFRGSIVVLDASGNVLVEICGNTVTA
jgi:hypothetical protein